MLASTDARLCFFADRHESGPVKGDFNPAGTLWQVNCGGTILFEDLLFPASCFSVVGFRLGSDPLPRQVLLTLEKTAEEKFTQLYGVPEPEENKLFRVQYNVKGYMQPVLESTRTGKKVCHFLNAYCVALNRH